MTNDFHKLDAQNLHRDSRDERVETWIWFGLLWDRMTPSLTPSREGKAVISAPQTIGISIVTHRCVGDWRQAGRADEGPVKGAGDLNGLFKREILSRKYAYCHIL